MGHSAFEAVETVEAYPITVEDLVAAARAGEDSAWAELYERFTPVLRQVARRHRLEEADVADVVHATWEKCLMHLDRIRDARALPGWLVTTCRNESLRLIRARRRCVPVDDQILPTLTEATAGDPVHAVLEVEAQALFREAVDALPVRQRRLITALIAPDGRRPGYEELAESLAMPVGSIGPTRQRAVERLRRDLAPLVA